MKKPSELFDGNDKALIAEAITNAESLTSGEIVPAVVRVSGRYDRAEDIFGLLFAIVLLVVYWLFFPLSAQGGWSANGVGTPLWPMLLLLIGGFVIGAILATVIPALRLPFIARREMQEEVERRALETFQRLRIRATADATGVLIYVSLYEHMVRVIGDDAVTARFSDEDWQEICNLVVSGMKAGEPERGLANAIRRCGQMLQQHFPIREGDRNELSDGLILIDD